MKFVLLCLACACAHTALAQDKSKLLKSWICVSTLHLPDSIAGPDTMYIRYTFTQDTSFISFDQRWNEHPQPWSLDSDRLKIGIVNYRVLELTDSNLVLVEPGFRVMTFRDEQLWSRDSTHLVPDGSWNNVPVYTANRWFMPRLRTNSLNDLMHAALAGFVFDRVQIFIVSFVVGTDGGVDDIRIVRGIKYAYDHIVVTQLEKTSGHWTPAAFQGQPIQTRMVYILHAF
jgi:hypothetical protein